MLKYIFISTFYLFFVGVLYSQTTDNRILWTMGLTYKLPSNFKTYTPKSYCFEENPKLQDLMGCISKSIISDDGEFIAFLQVMRILTKEDSLSFNSIFPGTNMSPNSTHIGNIRNQIRLIHGESAKQNWRDYVEYWPKNKSQKIFNADTVVLYSAKLEGKDSYEGKYDHFGALYLHKKDRGFVNFFFLFTEKAKKRYKFYIDQMQKSIKYDDWTNLKETPDPSDLGGPMTIYKEGNEWKARE